jgi:antirestriction protein ArdC
MTATTRVPQASSVYQIVTETILKQLEDGNVPWRRPWTTAAPCNLVSQKEYRGINTFMLSASGFPSRYWMTYAQAQKLGGHVKKGEHGSIVTFWNIGTEKLNPKTGKLSKPFLDSLKRRRNLLRTLTRASESLPKCRTRHRLLPAQTVRTTGHLRIT